MSDCYPCTVNNQNPATLPPREVIYDDGLWRVAHAFNSSLPGWLVIVARRHITSLSELSADEAVALGPLIAALSRALEQVLSIPKTYVVFFAEAATFSHVHIHVVPRPPDDMSHRRGPHAFAYLSDPQEQWVPPDQMDRIATDVRTLLTCTT